MEAFRVNLWAFKNFGGSGFARVNLGRRRRFLAWGSVTMIDPIANFDADNAVAFDIFRIDGAKTAPVAHGGAHWGPPGSGSNLYQGAVVAFGNEVEFWLRSIHHQDLDAFGVGIVLTLD